MNDLRVALTFDAEHPSRPGNDRGAEVAILDAMAAGAARGTFFLQGRWASAYPELAGRMARDGHLIGSHSHYHAPLPLLSSEGLRFDLEEAERRIKDATGIDPKPWFRFPFGDGADDAGVLDALEAAGYRNVGWNVDSEDWREDASPPSVRDAVVEGALQREDAVVVLFHTWSAATAAALPSILEDLQAHGASFLSAAELAS
jgi:peptidoglycan/xylan/chitin deacetylase (PgdA/CDA1 family)